LSSSGRLASSAVVPREWGACAAGMLPEGHGPRTRDMSSPAHLAVTTTGIVGVVGRAKSENRRPKAERSPKTEGGKARLLAKGSHSGLRTTFGSRVSDFSLLSAFGIWTLACPRNAFLGGTSRRRPWRPRTRRVVARRDDLWYIRPVRGKGIGKVPPAAAAAGVRPRAGRATNREEMLI